MNKNNSPTKRKFKGIWIEADILKLNVEGMLLIHRLLLAEIKALSNFDNPCTAGNQHLANHINVSPRTISRSICWLHERNLIKMWYEKSGKNGRRILPNFLKFNEQNAGQNGADHRQIDQGIEEVDPSQHDNGLRQSDQDARQIGNDLSQNVNHRIPLEYNLEHLQNIERGKSLSQNEEGQILEVENSEDKDIVNASPQVPRRPPSEQPILFRDSEVADLELFCNCFVGTDYEVADLRYYHEIILNWSNSGGNKKLDWIATARSWMLRDKQNNKFVFSKTHKHLNNEKSVVDPAQAKRVAEQIRKEALEADY